MNVINQVIALSLVLVSAFTNANESCIKVDALGTNQESNIVLISGFISDKRVWQPIATKLADQHRVHIVSIAGFGETPKCNHFSDIYNVAKNDISKYITANQLKNTSIVGHSMGGLLALDIALHQDITIIGVLSVDGLPFIGPVFSRSNATQVSDLSQQAQFIRTMYQTATPDKMAMMTMQSAHIQTKQQGKVSELLNMAKQSDPQTAASAMYSVMTTDLRPGLSKLTVPYLLLGASGGFDLDKDKQAMENLYKGQIVNQINAQVTMNTQSKHFLMWDEPHWLQAQISDFVEGL
ncbi:alpha/beta hydrolase [Shewanella sp. 202IG2-18]|uniref:alpha/beta fold hydrolase n=1 Tax=Parashewanella hymeniacidonis TaxID=2807618 RepID=UPI00195FE5DD|nr:alpha/beta hydrolase [Parashewanella hymeniacidonis]MBM7074379.1 alpha/beta hydrolase [Parashewanella hymeniacidonis]